jgi:DNA-binding NtrC family response regulator
LITPSKPSILIIDDDLSILNTFNRIFQRNGFCVATAEKGQEAIDKLNNNCFDVALVDFCLPDMEGSDLLPHIQRTSPKAVRVLLTGKASLIEGVNGADALLSKPINPEKLLSIIESKLKALNIET